MLNHIKQLLPHLILQNNWRLIIHGLDKLREKEMREKRDERERERERERKATIQYNNLLNSNQLQLFNNFFLFIFSLLCGQLNQKTVYYLIISIKTKIRTLLSSTSVPLKKNFLVFEKISLYIYIFNK